MIIPTRDNFGSSSCNTSDTYRDAAEDIATGRQTLDPALLAAKLLLRRAMEEAGTTPEQVGADGMVSVVIVANSEWTQVVCRAWCDIARGGQRWEDGDRAYVRGARTWLAWVSNEALRPVVAKESNEIVAKAVSQARHCAGFSPDAAWLPTDLVYTADYRLTLPKLTGNDVGRIAAELCGSKPTTCLSDDDAASLTPRLLRLVRRPNQGSAGYVAKLADLLDHDRATHSPPSAATSPRDEPTLDRLHGMDEAVAWGLDLVRDLGAFGRDELDWTSVDKGCLLSGPPGCGKTLFARALATTCNVALVTGSYGRWLGSGSGHQGDLLKAMSKTFTEARSKTPCILFIDEVDSFPNRSTLTHHYADWEIQVVNALLAEIDGVEGRAGVVLMAACNHPDKLDPALIRSGRLDRHIRVRLPNSAALEKILREHLGSDVHGAPLETAALATAGSTGADCERLVRGARRRARTAGRPMTIGDLVDEIGGDESRTPDAIRVAAVHEAGHGVAACILRPGCLQALTLRSNGAEGGLTSSHWSGDLIRARDINARLIFLLAGRAAEEAFFREPSSGSGGDIASDLALATQLAVRASSVLGFDPGAGLVWSGWPDSAKVPDMMANDPALKERVRQTLDTAFADALTLIHRHRDAVDSVSNALMQRRALSGDTVADLVALHSGSVQHTLQGISK